MSQKINFNLDNEYTAKFNHLMNVLRVKHKVDLLKELIDNYILLEDKEEKILQKFISKTFYTRKKFFNEAISKYIDYTVKKHGKS
jgi:hypothetical protein